MPNRVRAVLVTSVLCILPGMLGIAQAHDWFTGLTDPVTGSRCCGGTDCAVVPSDLVESGAISQTQAGYVIRLNLAQVRYFNRSATKPISQLVPMNRVQSNQTGGYALCIWKNEVQCFFAPSNV
jgi:hypothetical protein